LLQVCLTAQLSLMFVPKDANLRGLVAAERAVATKCKENEAKRATINLLFKGQLDMLFEDNNNH